MILQDIIDKCFSNVSGACKICNEIIVDDPVYRQWHLTEKHEMIVIEE